jgi:hypothetical protein
LYAAALSKSPFRDVNALRGIGLVIPGFADKALGQVTGVVGDLQPEVADLVPVPLTKELAIGENARTHLYGHRVGNYIVRKSCRDLRKEREVMLNGQRKEPDHLPRILRRFRRASSPDGVVNYEIRGYFRRCERAEGEPNRCVLVI